MFIRLMMEETKHKSLSYYANQLNVSTKTLQTDLKNIKKHLDIYGISIYAERSKGILIDDKAKSCLKMLNDLSQFADDIKKDPARHRKNQILKRFLFNSDEKTSIQKLADEYFVSKTSIVSDLNKIDEWLKQYNLELKRTKTGTYISGDEIEIRKAIAGYALFENTRNSLLVLFEPEDIGFIEGILSKVVEQGLDISDVSYVNLLTHILLCINRVRKNQRIRIEETERMICSDTSGQYQSAIAITEEIDRHYGIQIGSEETNYIYRHLISSGVASKALTQTENEEIYVSFANEMIEILSERLGIDFRQEEYLIKNLVNHIGSMQKRLKYGTQAPNPLKEEIYRLYPKMVKECSDVLKELCDKYRLGKVSEDEITSIVIYYQTILEKLSFKKRVLVVCHSGFGTSQLMMTRIQNTFPFMEIMAVTSSRKAEEMELEGIDSIISTVPIRRTDVPHIVISALLTEQDVKTIRNSFVAQSHN
jgi:transcriptional antiterminator